jgi:futalosine hydrolase
VRASSPRLLVCAATEFELACFPEQEGVVRVVTGVGIPQTLLRLPSLLAKHQPTQVLNIGIAGAYPNCGLKIGDLVWAESEVFGDLGFEQPDGTFHPIQGSAFGEGYGRLELAYEGKGEPEPAAAIGGSGCTVNTCTGTRTTGEFRRDHFGVQFETMEGAAVVLCCQRAGVPVHELRAISNIAAERDMRPENIKHALERLGAFLRQWKM